MITFVPDEGVKSVSLHLLYLLFKEKAIVCNIFYKSCLFPDFYALGFLLIFGNSYKNIKNDILRVKVF